MENTTNAHQVMGPGVPRPKVSTFSGQQPFPQWQQELFNSYVSTAPNSMDSKSLGLFEELQQQIAYLEKEIKTHKPVKEYKTQGQVDAAEAYAKNVPALALLKTKQVTWQKEDLIVYAIIQASVAGNALPIAFPKTETFSITSAPQLQGAKAYERLRVEYTKRTVHPFDKFGDKEILKAHFNNPNLQSPQVEVMLNAKVVEFITKHSLDPVVSNDLYLELTCITLHGLPDEPMYQSLHVKFRLAISTTDVKREGGHELFMLAIKEAQEIFEISKDIAKEASAMKSVVTKTLKGRQDQLPATEARLQKTKRKGQVQIPKPKNICLYFNSPDGCQRQGCHFLHEKASKEVLDAVRATHKQKRATAALAWGTATLASIAEAKKQTIPLSSPNIKPTEFYSEFFCSLSSSIPKLLVDDAYLDTGASHSMSPNENMFTDLMVSRIEIHCANHNIIYSTKVGVFHLKTVLHDGTETTLHIKNALFVPKLSATLISDRSLIQLGYSITIEKNKQLLKNGTKEIELVRHSSGIISFPLPAFANQTLPIQVHGLAASNALEKTAESVSPKIALEKTAESVSPKIATKTMSLADLHFKHECFAHINIDSTIAILRDEGYSISTKQHKAFFCLYCAQSKAKALPAHSDGATSLRPTQALGKKKSTIHTDVAGPIKPIGPNNEQYIISFREDGTKLLWTGTFKSMDQVPNMLAKYARDMSNAILSVPIVPHAAVLLSDSASVYLTPKMKQLLADLGVITAASVPYHPKSNSVSERGWLTLCGLARSMLAAAKKRSPLITSEFWPQAIAHATLIINLTTLSHGPKETSAFEMITNTPPSKVLQKLLPFGCHVVVKLETSHSKLESNGFQGSVVGYDLTSQGHMVFNHITGKTIVTANTQPDISSYYKDDLVGGSDDIVFNITPDDEDREGRDIQSTNQLNNVVQDLFLEQQHDVQKPQELFDDPEIFKTPLNSPSGLLFLSVTPNSLAKALTGPDKDKWVASIKKELQSMLDHKVYEEATDTKQPRMKSFVMLRVKPDDGSESGELFKSRLVAGGNTQQANRDYDPNRISSSVLMSSSMRMIFCWALEHGVRVYHIDVKTAFLNVPSEFDNYMEMPKILVTEFGVPPLVKLLKALYGTKDAPLLWWQLLHDVLVEELEFVQATNDSCLYFHKNKKIALGVYVDDMPTAASQENYRWVVQELEKRFQITDKGVLTRCLGMNVIQSIVDGKLVSDKNTPARVYC